jgi:hypothetical protein
VTKGRYQETVVEDDTPSPPTVEAIFHRLVEGSRAPIADLLVSGQWKKDYLIILNGTLTRDPGNPLHDQDRVLITTIMGGG